MFGKRRIGFNCDFIQRWYSKVLTLPEAPVSMRAYRVDQKIQDLSAPLRYFEIDTLAENLALPDRDMQIPEIETKVEPVLKKRYY